MGFGPAKYFFLISFVLFWNISDKENQPMGECIINWSKS